MDQDIIVRPSDGRLHYLLTSRPEEPIIRIKMPLSIRPSVSSVVLKVTHPSHCTRKLRITDKWFCENQGHRSANNRCQGIWLSNGPLHLDEDHLFFFLQSVPVFNTGFQHCYDTSCPAGVAELADALDLGSSGVTPVEVRVLSPAFGCKHCTCNIFH